MPEPPVAKDDQAVQSQGSKGRRRGKMPRRDVNMDCGKMQMPVREV